MPSSAVLYDPESAAWLRFGNLVEEIEVLTPDQVLPTIDALDKRVEKEGLYAAGFISYEAAAAFDEALQTRDREDFPLLRFGLFASLETIDLPAPAKTLERLNWQTGEDAWEFALGARYASRWFRLEDDDVTEGSVAADRRLPAYVRVTWRPDDDLDVSLTGGVDLYRDFEIRNEHGNDGKRYDADPGFFEQAFIHLHVPAGATPKDGPSAGITIATAIASARVTAACSA